MIATELVSGRALTTLHLTDYLQKIDKFLGRNYDCSTFSVTENENICRHLTEFLARMEDDVCLVGYFDCYKEMIYTRTFVYRGSVINLAENIIGCALSTGSAGLIIIRNRKSGCIIPQKNDRKLIRLLLTGLKIVGVKLVDYILNGQETIIQCSE